MNIRIVCVLICLIALGCQHPSMEESFFFKNPVGNRHERLRQYSLEDQYNIFRYGNDRIEPPVMGLADPIAERGATSVPFLLDQLNSKSDDMTVRDILLIFQTMAGNKNYDVKSDAVLMRTLASKISEMKDKEWQAITFKILQRIKDS